MHVLKGQIDQAYELFLELPVAVVLAMLWLLGAVLGASCVVALYAVGRVVLRALGVA